LVAAPVVVRNSEQTSGGATLGTSIDENATKTATFPNIPSKSRDVKASRLEAGKACWKAQGYAEGIVE
jgi:hypothetical protein